MFGGTNADLCITYRVALKCPTMPTIHIQEIEKVFTQAVIDLHAIIVIDAIEILSAGDGLRIRSHDLHGPLPELIIGHEKDSIETLDRVRNRACWLTAISGIRKDLRRLLPGCRMLPATWLDGSAVVGLIIEPRTFLAQGNDFLEAYHKLRVRVIGPEEM
jgi:hypothetical protein